MPVRANVVTTWHAAMSAAREPVKPALKNAGMPATRALVAATTSVAVSSVRGPPPPRSSTETQEQN